MDATSTEVLDDLVRPFPWRRTWRSWNTWMSIRHFSPPHARHFISPVKGRTQSALTLMVRLTQNKLNTTFPISSLLQRSACNSAVAGAHFTVPQRSGHSRRDWWFGIITFYLHSFIWLATFSLSWILGGMDSLCSNELLLCNWRHACLVHRLFELLSAGAKLLSVELSETLMTPLN